jgi:Protein of unknown function (DUF3999)
MRRNRLSLALGLLLVAGTAFAQENARDRFAYAAKIDAPGEEVAYQVTLPLHVYQNTVSPAFDDLRIVNAAGEVLPYALATTASVKAADSTGPEPVSFYPLRGDAALGAGALKLSIRSDGTTVDIQGSQSGTTAKHLLGYLLDVRKINRPFDELVLHWPEDADDFSLTLNVEMSDNLLNWTSAGTAAIANLHYIGQTFLQPRLSLGGVSAHYLRLTWRADETPVELTAVEVIPLAGVTMAARLLVQSRALAVANAPAEFRFELPGRLPVDRVNIQLPEANSAALAEIQSRSSEKVSWHSVASINLYRLRTRSASEVVNPAAAVAMTSDRYWRVVLTPAPAASVTSLSVDTSWLPMTVQFLARGAKPYELLYGNVDAKSAATPLQALLAGLQTSDAGLSQARLATPLAAGGPVRLQPAPPAPVPLPWKTWVLWATLVAGAILIGTLAFRMLREPDAPHAD